jgi:hypothetical protein
MDTDERREQVADFFNISDPDLVGELGEALYSMSELGMWPDSIDSVSVTQAMLCWKVVEKMRRETFPDALKM